MGLLNRYFGPFAAALVVSAIGFSQPDKKTTWVSLGVLAFALAANFWISRYSYRFIKWTQYLRGSLIWINWLWSVVLVYLLGGWWGPMWLLFLMAPATAAMHGSRRLALASAAVSAASLLGIYWVRGAEGSFVWGQASLHAAFIVFFTLFVHALAQTALRLRDAALRV